MHPDTAAKKQQPLKNDGETFKLEMKLAKAQAREQVYAEAEKSSKPASEVTTNEPTASQSVSTGNPVTDSQDIKAGAN